MVDTITAALIGASGIALGAIITIIGSRQIAKKNHQYRMQQLEREHEKRIEYMKEEIFFKKKLEYFEYVSEIIQNRINNCGKIILELRRDKPNIKELNELKNKIIDLQNIALYHNDLSNLGLKVISFQEGIIEFNKKEIEFIDEVLINNKIGKENKFLSKLEKQYSKIIDLGATLTKIMRKELEK